MRFLVCCVVAIYCSQIWATPFTKQVADLTQNEYLALSLLHGTSTYGIFEAEKVERVLREISLIRGQMPEAREMGDYRSRKPGPYNVDRRYGPIFNIFYEVGTHNGFELEVNEANFDSDDIRKLKSNERAGLDVNPSSRLATKIDFMGLLKRFPQAQLDVTYHLKKSPSNVEVFVLRHATYVFPYSDVIDIHAIQNDYRDLPLSKANSVLVGAPWHNVPAGDGDTVTRVELSPTEAQYFYVQRRGSDCAAGCGHVTEYSYVVNVKTGVVQK